MIDLRFVCKQIDVNLKTYDFFGADFELSFIEII